MYLRNICSIFTVVYLRIYVHSHALPVALKSILDAALAKILGQVRKTLYDTSYT